jgi:hypothetical protein
MDRAIVKGIAAVCAKVITNRQPVSHGKRDRPRQGLTPSSWASCCGWGWCRLVIIMVSLVPLSPCECPAEGGCGRGDLPPCPEGILRVRGECEGLCRVEWFW